MGRSPRETPLQQRPCQRSRRELFCSSVVRSRRQNTARVQFQEEGFMARRFLLPVPSPGPSRRSRAGALLPSLRAASGGSSRVGGEERPEHPDPARHPGAQQPGGSRALGHPRARRGDPRPHAGVRKRAEAALKKVRGQLQARLGPETDPPVKQDLQILLRYDRRRPQRGGARTPGTSSPTSTSPRSSSAGSAPCSTTRWRRRGGRRPWSGCASTPASRRRRPRSPCSPSATPAPGSPTGPARPVQGRGGARPRQQRDGRSPASSELFKKYGVAGYEEPYARLKEQLAAYDGFVRKEILPRARTDFRLPPELYAYRLEQVGVDMPVEELVGRAHVAFKEIQSEMATPGAAGRQGEGHSAPTGLPRRAARAQEEADHRRGHPPLLRRSASRRSKRSSAARRSSACPTGR